MSGIDRAGRYRPLGPLRTPGLEHLSPRIGAENGAPTGAETASPRSFRALVDQTTSGRLRSQTPARRGLQSCSRFVAGDPFGLAMPAETAADARLSWGVCRRGQPDGSRDEE